MRNLPSVIETDFFGITQFTLILNHICETLMLNELQQWLLDFGRPYLIDDSQQRSSGLNAMQRGLLQQQKEWRRRGRFRFPQPEKWLWSDQSLAQASDWLSACFKASLFPPGVKILDGCCGAGVDCVALAMRGPVLAVDQDPWLVALAVNNAAAHGFKIEGVAAALDAEIIGHSDWLHVDPDRRAQSIKTTRADLFSPSIEDLLRWSKVSQGTMIKVAPSTRFEASTCEWIKQHLHRLWIGSNGQCRQQLLLSGAVGKDSWFDQLPEVSLDSNRRTAAILAQPVPFTGLGDLRSQFRCWHYSSDHTSLDEFGFPSTIEDPECLGRYVFDLHATLHASDLHHAWALQQGLSAITDPRGYFSGDQPLHSPFCQCFEVIEVVSFDDRKLRKWLKSRQVGNVEVKCRLHHLDASALQRKYSGTGDNAISLLITRLGQSIRAIACKRIAGDDIQNEVAHEA